MDATDKAEMLEWKVRCFQAQLAQVDASVALRRHDLRQWAVEQALRLTPTSAKYLVDEAAEIYAWVTKSDEIAVPPQENR